MSLQAEIDKWRSSPVPERGHFVNGDWCAGDEARRTEVVSPIDGRPFTTIRSGSAADVDRAVASACRAFDEGSWSGAPPARRKSILLRIAELIEQRSVELAVLGCRDNGTEIGMALRAEPLGAAATFRYYAEALDKVYGEIAPTDRNFLGLVHREPVGVVAAIVPWNMPMMIAAWKIAPALAAGNSVVLKPAEAASLTLLELAGIAAEAGLPAGVFNVVTGRGQMVGKALARHPNVDVLAFTGSGPVGRSLLHDAADTNLKRVYLELGGKSPNIVFADASDLDRAASAAVNAIFRNSGQVCVAGSRLLVERSIHQVFVEKVAAATERLVVGDPLDTGSDIGAIISEHQLGENTGFIRRAEAAGARRVTGGERILEATGGFYQRPAVIDNVAPDSELATQEVFGPVLAVTPFDTEEEAATIANSTTFGLAAGLWTANLSRAHRMVARVDSGLVHVNTYGGSDLTVPLGGHRQSGFGHDKSLHALDKYIKLKSAWIAL